MGQRWKSWSPKPRAGIELTLKFLSVKEVPRLFWSSPKPLTITPPFMSMVFLVIGLIIFGLGEALLIAAGVGVSPWIVFAQGITHVTGWSVGFATFVVSVAVLVCWIPLRQMPGIGTVLNAVIIALVLDYSLPYLPVFDSITLRVAEAVAGVLITGLGSGLYPIANLGPGPRDGLMTGLQSRTGAPPPSFLLFFSLPFLSIGWALGGTVGIGTVLFAFGIGPSVAASMYGLKTAFSKYERAG